MNPDLERRIRRYGTTVDAAAEAESARLTATAALPGVGGPRVVGSLDNVVPIARRRPRWSAIAIGVAAAAVLIAGLAAFVGRGRLSTDVADRPVDPTAAPVIEPSPATSPPLDSTPAVVPTAAAAPVTAAAPTTAAAPVNGPTAPDATDAGPQAPAASPRCPSYTAHNDYHLETCDSGVAVRLVQERLKVLVDSTLTVDGYFGPGTESAVRTFQLDRGLTVDGQVGPATWRLLVPDAPGTDLDGSGVVDPSEVVS